MSIERIGDRFALFCDICGEGEDYETFEEAVQGCKDLGWMIRRVEDGTWENICEECYKGENE